jgi:hypothetical protein
MLPTLRSGDRLLVRGGRDAVRRVRPGALAVVRLPQRPLSIKRLTFRDAQGWWAERDNPTEGVDSWLLGAVADDDVLAVAVARIWPQPRLLPAAPPSRQPSRRPPRQPPPESLGDASHHGAG